MKRLLCAVIVLAMLFNSVDLTVVASQTEVSGDDLAGVELEPEAVQEEETVVEETEDVLENDLTEESTEVLSGQCGDNVYWSIEDGVLTISGTGDMWDYTAMTAPWYSNTNMTSLIIQEGITRISDYAFYGCNGFTGNLVIPESVTSIGSSVFYGCSGFTGDLIIPESVTSIGDYAFEGCSGFTGNLIIPESVTSIGSSVFYGCSGFTGDLIIPESVTSIGDSAFMRCSGFTGDLIIPEGVTSIGDYAFKECSGFTGDLIIQEGSIGDYAFDGCSGFTGNLIIQEGVTSIGDEAFEGCSGFTGDLIIPESVTNIGDEAFEGCSGFTGNLVIPESVTSIGSSVFYGCSGFTGNLIIQEGVTSIGHWAFEGCSGFTGNLIIPESVTSIGYWAFMECSGFTGDLIIPKGVTSIGDYAFGGCSGFTGNLIIQEGVTSIGDYAFEGCSGFTGNLIIQEGVTSIGAHAFGGCSGFTGDLIIPEGVTSIGYGAFSGCSGFTGDLIIQEGVTSIGDYAFDGCSGFTGDLIIPGGVTNIGDEAFEGCSGFTGNLVIPESVTSIGSSVFYGCSGFTGNLVIPESVTSIGISAFGGCSGFTGDLIIPESVTSIGISVFYGCSGFTGDLIIPESVTSIGYGAFSGCSGFTGDLIIPESVTSIDDKAFYNCSGLNGKAFIPPSVEDIGYDAFNTIHTIYGESGSYAETYAIANNITFIPYNFDGLDNGTIEDSITSDIIHIYVLDEELNFPIEGAVVNGKTTNSNGYVSLPLLEAQGDFLFTVTADGYNAFMETKEVEPNGSYYFSLQSSTGSFDIVYAGAKIGETSRNLLTGKLYLENTSEDVAMASDKTSLEIEVKARGTVTQYELLQNDKVIGSSTDGKFTIPVLQRNSANPCTNLLSQKSIVARATSADGKVTFKTLGIYVGAEGTAVEEKEKSGSISIGSGIGFTIPNDVPFLGGASVNYGFEKGLPFDLEVSANGQVKIAINKEASKSFDKFKEDYNKLSGRAQQLSDAAQAFGGTPQSFGGGYTSIKASASGYGEGYIDMNKPGFFEIKVGVIVSGKGSAGYTQYFFAGYVPIYVSVEAGVKVSGELNLKVTYENQEMKLDGGVGNISGKIYLTPKAGIGVDNLLSVGVSGTGECNYLWKPKDSYNKVWLSAYMELYANCFGWDFDIWKSDTAEWLLYETPKATAANSNALRNRAYTQVYDSHSYKLMDRSYLERNIAPLEVAESGPTVVQSSVYPGASPRLVEAGNKLYLFWLQDIASRTSENRASLVYAASEDGQNWSEPIQVVSEEENQTADNGFDVYVDGDTIYVCWQDAAVSYESGINLDNAMQKLYIAYAVIDAGSGTAKSHEVITSEMGCYLLPKICTTGNKIEVSWVRNEMTVESGLWNQSNTQKLMKWDSVNKQVTELPIGSGKEKIVSMDAAVTNTQTGVVYILDQDGDIATITDRVVYYDTRQQEGTGSKELLTTSAGTVSNVVVENGYCYWYAEENIYFAPVGSTQVSKIYEVLNATLPGDFSVVDVNGKTSIFWSAIEQETEKVAVYGITGEGHSNWSAPFVVEQTDSEMTGVLSAAGHGGKLQFAYLHIKNGTDGSKIRSICTFTEQGRTDIAVKYALYDNDDFKPGQVLPITVGITNKGNTPVETVELKWDDTFIGIATVNLAAGETKEIIIDKYTVPENITGYEEHTLTVAVSGENELSDNQYPLGIGYTDVSVLCSQRLQNENTWFDISVLNKSSIDTNCVLNIRADEEDGEILYTEDLGSIKGGQGLSMTVDLRKYESSCCTYFVEAVTDVPDAIEGNNVVLMYTGYGTDVEGGSLVGKPTTYTVTFDSNGGSAVDSQIVEEDSSIVEPSQPQREGYHFAGWYLNGELYNFIMPVTSDITLTAQWTEYEVLASPSASIVSGSEVEAGTKVVLTCAATGASIYYTLDGTMPTTASTCYTEPITIIEDTVITAMAVLDGYKNSEVVTFTYTVSKTQTTTFIVAFQSNGGSAVESQKVEKDAFAVEPNNPVREGFEFVGWYLNGTLFVFTTPVTENIVLEAKWKEITEEPDEPEDTGEVLPEDMPEDGVIPAGLWVGGLKNQTYTGKAIKPEFRVYDGNVRLREKTDYTVSYKNNTKANDAFVAKTAPTITVTGKGNYTGKATKTFEILKQDIGAAEVEVQCSNILLAYNGKEQKPMPVLTFNGKKLKNKTDFTVDYPDVTPENPGAYREPGTYRITVKGMNNFELERTVYVTITSDKLLSKLKIKKLANERYDGTEKKPQIVLTDGKYTLTEEDFSVEYKDNLAVGTATVILRAKEGSGYAGERIVTFKITGTSISKAKLQNPLSTVGYQGSEWKPDCQLAVTVGTEKIPLTENREYTVTYQKNINAGTATILFTGVPEYGFTGTMKKTFTITPYDIKADSQNKISVEEGIVIAYAKGGSKPEPVVTFGETVLTLGKDYTLKYSNNKAVNDGSDERKSPTITVTGKGNFKGSTSVDFKIEPQDIGLLQMTVADKAAQTKPNKCQSVPKIIDLDGKTLKAGTDYEKALEYTYGEETLLADGTIRREGEKIQATDILPINTLVKVTATGKGNYRSDKTLSGTYRIIEAAKDISKAKVVIKPQSYTGYAVEPGKDKIQITMKGVDVPQENYEIVDYSNNVKKGTATIILQGVGKNYGGTKKATFKIQAKGMTWWEKVVSFF